VIDFAQLKKDIPIENAVGILGLEVKQEGNQLRGPCPACKRGGERALVITPSKSAWYCFNATQGGDLLNLVQHIAGLASLKQAGEFLVKFAHNPKPADATDELKPLDYLSTEHELLTAVGIPDDVCKAVGIGYAPRGLMQGTVAIPLRLPDGKLVGYVGIHEVPKIPKLWHL